MKAHEILAQLRFGIGEDGESDTSLSFDHATSEDDLFAGQLVAFINRAGEEIAARGAWSSLLKTTEIPADSEAIARPDDFGKLASVTTGGGLSRLVTDPALWALLIARPSAQACHFVDGAHIRFAPAIGEDGGQLRYYSNAWVAGGKTGFARDEDRPLVPASLIVKGAEWRWKRNKGLPFEDTVAEFEAMLIARLTHDRGLLQ